MIEQRLEINKDKLKDPKFFLKKTIRPLNKTQLNLIKKNAYANKRRSVISGVVIVYDFENKARYTYEILLKFDKKKKDYIEERYRFSWNEEWKTPTKKFFNKKFYHSDKDVIKMILKKKREKAEPVLDIPLTHGEILWIKECTKKELEKAVINSSKKK